MTQATADYDSYGYDYRSYWADRDYEQWAEDRALRRCVPLLGRPDWLIDFGGGYGRNATHYREAAGRYVIVDHSVTNLRNAADLLADDLADGRAFLVRCDLNRLPFCDGAFDAALVVRVLHHLADIDRALGEMGRTVRTSWLLDVPIKHHVLGVLRGVARGELAAVRGQQPLCTGTSEQPFWNFRLSAVRELLARDGWRTRLAASVNNLRRWDRALPPPLVRAMHPGVRLAEAAVQRGGRGWWGPSQLMLAQRWAPTRAPQLPTVTGAGVPEVADRMACPSCRGPLSWTTDLASCPNCAAVYPRRGRYWDFTTTGPR